MSDVRPSGGVEDGAARLLASAHARLATVAADLALPAALRLTEWQRATVSALLSNLIRDIEDELRAGMLRQLPHDAPEGLRAALGAAGLPIALPLIEARPLLVQPSLLSLLLRRAEEHRLAAAGGEQGLLGTLAGDEDASVASEAMALLIAQNGRFDSFHEPLIGHSDLPADLRHQLVWTAAAALRRYMIVQHRLDPAAADAALSDAAAAMLSGYDEGDGVEARALRLAALLARRGRLDDGLVSRAGEEGNLPLLLAMLAVRTGLGLEAAWDLLADRAGAPILLRAAHIERSAAAAIFFRLAVADAAVAAQLDRFDTLSAADVVRMLAPWRVDAAYRAAIAELAR